MHIEDVDSLQAIHSTNLSDIVKELNGLCPSSDDESERSYRKQAVISGLLLSRPKPGVGF